MCVCSLYAPHQRKPYEGRLQLYQKSGDWQVISAQAIIGCSRLQCRVTHSRFAAEKQRLGEYIFGYTSAEPHPESNRQLLLELCKALDLVVGNVVFAQPPSRQVTVCNVGSNPCSALIPAKFGQIYFILTNTDWLRVLQDVASCMDMVLASHHFPIIVQFDVAIPKQVAQPRVHQFDVASFESHVVGNRSRELLQTPKWKTYMQTTSPPMRCVLTCEFAMNKLLVNACQRLQSSQTMDFKYYIAIDFGLDVARAAQS